VRMLVTVALVVGISTFAWLSRAAIVNFVMSFVPVGMTTHDAPAPSSVPAPASPDSPPTVLPPAPAAAPTDHAALFMTLNMRRDAWMRVVVDGRSISARLFKAGETQHIADAKRVSIRIGDAGAVLASVNGGEPKAMGRDGEVMTRHFVADEPGVALAPVPAAAGASAGSLTRPTGMNTETRSAVAAGERNAAVLATAITDTSEPVATPQAPVASQPSSATAPPITVPRASDPVGAGQQWFDAYHRQDLEGMAVRAVASLKVSDYRNSEQRIPAGLPDVRRTFENVKFQAFGNAAVLTATMTEHAVTRPAAPMTVVSLISQTWTRQQDIWYLAEVRIVSRHASVGVVR
jgi:hypothetical protein